jgi:hypothetical protein
MVKFIDWSVLEDDDEDVVQPLLNQLLAFPEGNHDDMADALSLVVNHANITAQSIFGGSYGERNLW